MVIDFNLLKSLYVSCTLIAHLCFRWEVNQPTVAHCGGASVLFQINQKNRAHPASFASLKLGLCCYCNESYEKL